MSELLSLKLRPKDFSKLFGQAQIVSAIAKQIESGRDPRAWMFIGETGSGKTTLARILALSLNCSHQERFGFPCEDCYSKRKRLNIFEVNASEYNGVDAVKELVIGSDYAPVPPSKQRVYILDEAHMLSKQAQNLLLKYFEDAPPTTTWIIATTDPQNILRTLRSRCLTYQLQPLRGREAERFIRWAGKRAKATRDLTDFIEFVHTSRLTSPRMILMSLERYISGLDPDKAITGSESNVDTLRIARSLVAGEWPPIRRELERATVEDVRQIRGGLLGYLRAIMLNRKPSVKLDVVAGAIEDLSNIKWGIDEASQFTQLIALLYRISKRF